MIHQAVEAELAVLLEAHAADKTADGRAVLLQRVQNGADAMSARESLAIATLSGDKVLGQPDCGFLEVGKRADLAVWEISGLETAGAWDPVAALILCGPFQARNVFVDGRAVVRGARLAELDAEPPGRAARQAVSRLMQISS